MEVGHGFTSMRAVVHHDAETLSQFFGFCDCPGDKQQVPEQLGVLFNRLGNTPNGLSWYYQNVNRSLRINVAENHASIILMDEVSWDFTIDYLAEESLFGHRGHLDEE
jgi:hypothetical protein